MSEQQIANWTNNLEDVIREGNPSTCNDLTTQLVDTSGEHPMTNQPFFEGCDDIETKY